MIYREETSTKKIFKVSWFFIFFEIFRTVLLQKTKSSSVAVTLKICTYSEGKFCASYTADIHLFEIERQILWLFEIHLFEFEVVFCHLNTKLNLLNKILCFMNCSWLQETFWQYVTVNKLDKYNVSKQCEESRSSE